MKDNKQFVDYRSVQPRFFVDYRSVLASMIIKLQTER